MVSRGDVPDSMHSCVRDDQTTAALSVVARRTRVRAGRIHALWMRLIEAGCPAKRSGALTARAPGCRGRADAGRLLRLPRVRIS